MDEAASKERLKTLTPPPALKEMEDKLVSLAAEKEEAIQNQEFERAATLRDQEKELKQQVESAKKDWQSKDTSASKIVDETEHSGRYFRVDGNPPSTSWPRRRANGCCTWRISCTSASSVRTTR